MKANEIKITDFLTKSQTKFIIPLYQRNYDWKEEQCEQLIEDIENIIVEGLLIKVQIPLIISQTKIII